MKSPQDVARKWARNLAASTDSIKSGVQNVTVSPTESAARRIDAQVEGVRRAAESGKTQRNLRRVTRDDWVQATLSKGLPRIPSGAQAAVPKMESFMSEWLPFEEQLKQKLASMPRGGLQENIARAVAAMEHNAAFSRR